MQEQVFKSYIRTKSFYSFEGTTCMQKKKKRKKIVTETHEISCD